jgi:hypothetical protein
MDAGMLKVSAGPSGLSPATQDVLQQLQGRQEAMKSAADFAKESMKKSQ